MTDTLSDIDKLLCKVAQDACQPDSDDMGINFHSRIEALKVLKDYYLALHKAKSLAAVDSGDETMDDLAQAIREPNGTAQVRGHRGGRESLDS